jgi:RNA polymerase sigma-70 factor (ECF subfamily)
LVAKFVRAYEAADLDALVALMTDDIFMSMPPIALEHLGRDLVARFCAVIFGNGGRRFDLVATRANGQPAFGAYMRTDAGVRPGCLITILLRGDRICALSRFESTVLPWGLGGRCRCRGP